MPTCVKCSRDGSRGFDETDDGDVCTNTAQCATRVKRMARALVAGRCVDCIAEGVDPKGTRKIAVGADDKPYPGPRCVTHQRARKKQVSAVAHERRIEQNYELTAEDYQAIYAAQGGKCFGCDFATGKTKRLAVDHDHELAKTHGHDPDKGCRECIRALLCGPCNQTIGRMGVEALLRLVEVLGPNPPARRVLLGEPPTIADDGTVLDRMSPEQLTGLAGLVPGLPTMLNNLTTPVVEEDGPPYDGCLECDHPPCAIHQPELVKCVEAGIVHLPGITDDPSEPEPTGDSVAIVDEAEALANLAQVGLVNGETVDTVELDPNYRWFDPLVEFWGERV